MMRQMVRRLWTYRDLVVSMTRRQYQLRYRQSLVGLWWASIPPLLTLGMATFLFEGVLDVDTGGVPYPIFAFAALVPWTFFSSAVTTSVGSITGSPGIVTRLAFPRAVLPLAMVGTSFFDLAIAGLAYVAFAIIGGFGIPLTALWVPVLIVILVVLTVGVALLLSALNVFARDFRLFVPLLMQLWLFLTPVMYPLSAVPPELRSLYMLNPITGLIESFRQVLIVGIAPSPALLASAVGGALVMFVLGLWYFAATEHRFADVI